MDLYRAPLIFLYAYCVVQCVTIKCRGCGHCFAFNALDGTKTYTCMCCLFVNIKVIFCVPGVS